MMNRCKISQNFFYSSMVMSAVAAIFLCLRVVKMSPILGAHFSFFSLSDVGMPLFGALGLGYASLSFLSRCMWRVIALHAGYGVFISHLPGLSGAFYWAHNTTLLGRIYAVVVPLVCMMLFVAHPVGGSAVLYTIYWFIPVGLSVFKSKLSRVPESVLSALTSTFIAHAVGSVIWLYTMPSMSACQWLSLLPVVPVERAYFAATMVLVYEGVRLVYYAVLRMRGLARV